MTQPSKILDRKFKVFVSSTYKDLKNERKKVIESLEQLQINYTAMEFFGARPGDPIEVSLDEVRSSNIYIGIIGHRYGDFVPEEDISYTEMEYNTASRLGLSRLIYLLSDSVPILPEQYENDPLKIQKLKLFKKKVKKRHTKATFISPDDLAKKIKTDIKNLRSGDSLYRGLEKKDFAGDPDSILKKGKFIDYWMTRRFEFIPIEFWRKICILENSEIVENTKLNTTYPHNNFIKLLHSIETKFLGITPIYHEDYLNELKFMMKKGVDIKLILDSITFKEVKTNLTPDEKSVLSSDPKIELYVCDNIDSGITISESFISLCLVSKNDINSLMDKYLTSENPKAISWGEELFNYYKSKSIRMKM